MYSVQRLLTPIRRVKLFQAVIDDLQERYEQVQKLKEEYGDKYEDNDLVCCYPYGGYIKPKRITEGFGVLKKKPRLRKYGFMIFGILMHHSYLR